MEKTRKISVKNDIVFKEIFAKKGNETFLQDFLSGLLKRKIEKIEIIKDASLTKNVLNEKLGIIDIKATLDEKDIVDIEMQMCYFPNMEERALYYSSKLISSQLKVAQGYEKLKPVIVIVILNKSIFPYEEHIGETKTIIKGKEEYEVMKKQKFYFIELEKYRKQKFNPEDKVSQWLAFIDGEDKERTSVAMKKNKEIKKANEEYEYLTGEEEIQRIAELKEKWERDYNSGVQYGYDSGYEMGIEEGIKKGIQDGIEEGIKKGMQDGIEKGMKNGIEKGIIQGENKREREIAKDMLKKNLDIDLISDITGLSKEEINNLKKS